VWVCLTPLSYAKRGSSFVPHHQQNLQATYTVLFFIWLVFWGFELRVLCLVGSFSTTCSMPLALCELVAFDIGSHFMLTRAWIMIQVPTRTMICACHHSADDRYAPPCQSLVDKGLRNILPSLAFNCDPPDLILPLTRI
jgi:hypothetical protein